MRWRGAGSLVVLVGLLACAKGTVTPEEGATPGEAGAPAANEASASHDDTSNDEPSQTPPDSDETDEGPTIAEALAARPDGNELTEAEFRAWDRKDPAGEKALHQWDAANFQMLGERTGDLQCFRHRIMAAGQAHLDGTLDDEGWLETKRDHVFGMDRWQKQLFADEPRIFEQSKYVSYVLEAHEVVVFGYPRAYNEGGGTPLQEIEAQWMVVLAKMRTYATKLGGHIRELSPADCQARSRR